MRTKQRSSQCGVPRASLLLTLTTIILFSCSQQSLAQQRDVDATNADSNSSSASNGRVNFNIIQLMNGEYLEMFGAGTSRGILRGHPSIPAIELGSHSADPLIFTTNTVERMRILSNGNVGIGTDDPLKKLHIFSSNSQVMIDRPANAPGNYALVNFATNRVTKFLIGMNADSDPGVDKLSFFEMGFNLGAPVMTITGGRLGIGTTAPAHKLDVVGEIRASAGFRFADGTLQTTAAVGGSGAVSSVFGRTGAVFQQTGDYTWAQINKSTSSLADIATRSASDLNAGTVPIARLGSGTPDSTKFLRGDNTWAVPAGTSQWTTTSGTNSISYNSGNVGIGTTNPTVKLEVIGDIKITGNINAKYQDVAEWVDSSQELVAGTVVVLDSSRSNHVIAATQSYDSRIAGVISLQPGLTLGEEAEGRVLVATTGRVRVKVDATEGAIQIGDLLVTSNREGFAMKSLPLDVGGVRMHRPGTLIGKALEPLAKGTGEILVLLSLQ